MERISDESLLEIECGEYDPTDLGHDPIDLGHDLRDARRERDEARAQVARLRVALLSTRAVRLPDTRCWCETRLGNEYITLHSEVCNEANAILADTDLATPDA